MKMHRGKGGGNDAWWKAQKRGFPPTLEIAARFPHSHRATAAIYFLKTFYPKGAFLRHRSGYRFRLILRLEKTTESGQLLGRAIPPMSSLFRFFLLG